MFSRPLELYKRVGIAALPIAYFTTNVPDFEEDCFIPVEELSFPVSHHGLQYGDSIFEGIKAYNKERLIFRPQDHNARMIYISAAVNKFDLPLQWRSPQWLTRKMVELFLQEENAKEISKIPEVPIYIRPFITPIRFSAGVAVELKDLMLAIYLEPMKHYLPPGKLLRLEISPISRMPQACYWPDSAPMVGKISGSYASSRLAGLGAKLRGYDEALVVRVDRTYISEASAMNVFFEKEGRLITPSLDQDNLAGVTRDTIVQLAKDLGISVEERMVEVAELFDGRRPDNAFLTGTAAEVAPVGIIEEFGTDRKWETRDGKPGPITLVMKNLYGKIVRGEIEPYRSRWCVPALLP